MGPQGGGLVAHGRHGKHVVQTEDGSLLLLQHTGAGAMSFANAKGCQWALVIQPFPLWLARVGEPTELSPLLM